MPVRFHYHSSRCGYPYYDNCGGWEGPVDPSMALRVSSDVIVVLLTRISPFDATAIVEGDNAREGVEKEDSV
jgi:hypothetical protein